MMEVSTADPADVASIDAIINAAYDGISGAAGEKRDWDRERSLFYPGARLIPTAKPGANHGLAPQMLDVEGFIAQWNRILLRTDFSKKKLPGTPNNSDTLLTCGARMNRATMPMIPNRLCGESTAYSCFTMAIAGGL
jgi:hypothetical protein